MALTTTEGKRLEQQIVEALAATERAINHARSLTDDSRDMERPLVRAARQLTDAQESLAEALRGLNNAGPATIVDCGTV